MKISVFGLGYVGSISAACLAQNGHDVLGIDVNMQKCEWINSGRAPIIEQGLDIMMREAVKRGNLRAISDSRSAVSSSDVSLICVGTPSSRNGSLDLQHVENVCGQIGSGLADKRGYHLVVVRSTLLPGSTEEKLIPLLEQHSGRRVGPDFGVCVNPEFLREGKGIADFYKPALVIFGEFDRRSGEVIEGLYKGIQAPTLRTTIRTAEMIKYANNAFHALKVVFTNEIGVFCKAHGIDGREVMGALCQDTQLNISSAYMKPGFGFGGSCLPKDLRALLYRTKERDLECSLLNAIPISNRQHIQRGMDLIERTGQKRIGVLGLSFKPGTDDMRESPVVELVEKLIGKGYSVHIYDEEVELGRLIGTNKEFLEGEIPHIASLMGHSLEEVVKWADVLVISHASRTYNRVPSLIREDQKLIDLVGIENGCGDIKGAYEGICW